MCEGIPYYIYVSHVNETGFEDRVHRFPFITPLPTITIIPARIAQRLPQHNISITITLYEYDTSDNIYLQDAITRLTSEQIPFHPPFVYHSPASSTVGKAFNVSLETLRLLHVIPESFTTLTSANADNVVFVTAASSNHFVESKNLITSVQTFAPGRLIVYYDLGLKPTQAKEVRSNLTLGTLSTQVLLFVCGSVRVRT